MEKKEIEKLIHCLNTLIIIKECGKLPDNSPGLSRIINDAKQVLIDNPEYVPDWFKKELI